jgi:hypothetical protein
MLNETLNCIGGTHAALNTVIGHGQVAFKIVATCTCNC